MPNRRAEAYPFANPTQNSTAAPAAFRQWGRFVFCGGCRYSFSQKIYKRTERPGTGAFFVGVGAPLGQRGREGVSTPPPYPLWTPYPPATTRAEPWTQKQKVPPGVWLKKLFTARQMYCASLFPGAIRPALRLCMRALRARLHQTRRTEKNRYTKSPHKQSQHTLHTSTQSNEKKAKTKK